MCFTARLAFAALVLGGAARAQVICYVDDDAPPGGGGVTWGTAFEHLQDALAAHPGGAEFRIAGGVQRPDLGAGVVLYDRLASFKPQGTMVFKGGFRGLAPGGSPNDRDLAAFATVVTGDLLGDGPGNTADDSYHLFELAGSVAAVTLDGMTWRDAHAIGSYNHAYGGGVRVAAGVLTMTDIVVERCSASIGGGVSLLGADGTITRCSFDHCSAGSGSGISCGGCTATVQDCSFSNSGGSAGALNLLMANVTVRNSTFVDATIYSGGAIYAEQGSTLLVEDSTFTNNSTSTHGGAIYSRESGTTVRRSTFTGNDANSGNGGGVFAWYGALSVDTCVFEGNSGAYGGGVHGLYPFPCSILNSRFVGNHVTWSGGGADVAQVGPSSMQVQNCQFFDNFAQRGGGLDFGGNGAIVRCAFGRNSGMLAGSGLRFGASTGQAVVVDHCTVSDSDPPNSSSVEVIVNGGTATMRSSIVSTEGPLPGPGLVHVSSGSLTVSYSDIRGLPAVWAGSGNIDVDPRFVAAAFDDLSLNGGSPCVDTGHPGAALDPDGTRSDMGAFPFDHRVHAYCTAATTSNGCVPQLAWSGVPSASAANGFALTCSSVEGGANGILYYGSAATISPWGSGGTSTRCVAAPLERMGTQSSGGNAGQCDGTLAEDWNAYRATHPTAVGSPFGAGQTFYAQAWFRDPPAVKSTNLSDALCFTLLP